MKLIPARYIVENAIQTGQIASEGTIVESSSGTFGIALAIVCAHYGIRLKLVTGPLSASLHWRLESLGVEFERIDKPTGAEGGIQQDRFNRLKAMMDKDPEVFWTQQHTNPLNPESYEKTLGIHCVEEIGPVDYFICSTGTGGSISGMSKTLRDAFPSIKIVAVDHNLSVLFGPTSACVSDLCSDSYNSVLGMGADVVSPNLDHTHCDQVHWVPTAVMIESAHKLHGKYGIFIGPTGASTFRVAEWIRKREPDARIMCMIPDHGVRYTDTIYNPNWLKHYDTDLRRTDNRPEKVKTPLDVAGEWVYHDWNRAKYADVLGFDPTPRAQKIVS